MNKFEQIKEARNYFENLCTTYNVVPEQREYFLGLLSSLITSETSKSEEMKADVFEQKIEEIYEVIHTGLCNELNHLDDGYEAKSKQMIADLITSENTKSGEMKADVLKVEEILTSFCADVYTYAHRKGETTGEYNEYFVTLEELDRVFTRFMQSQSKGDKQ